MNHIDISSVLRQTLACDLYSNLVTRPTGAAVRGQIEQMLERVARPRAHRHRLLARVDDRFLVRRRSRRQAADPLRRRTNSPQDAYFLFRGVTEDHRDAIESVLERHGLALALEQADGVDVMGVLTDDERRAWDASYRLGRGADAGRRRARRSAPMPTTRAAALDALCRRRL